MQMEMLDELTGKQTQAIAALVGGATQKQAAATAGVSENTVARWLQDETFKAAYRAGKRAALEAGIGALQGAFTDAVETLRRNLKCAVPGVEVRAALGLITQAYKGSEIAEIIPMLEQLEQDGVER